MRDMGEFAVRETAGPLPLIPILGYRSLCEIPFAVEPIDSIRRVRANRHRNRDLTVAYALARIKKCTGEYLAFIPFLHKILSVIRVIDASRFITEKHSVPPLLVPPGPHRGIRPGDLNGKQVDQKSYLNSSFANASSLEDTQSQWSHFAPSTA